MPFVEAGDADEAEGKNTSGARANVHPTIA
jgi:hypothetical protein